MLSPSKKPMPGARFLKFSRGIYALMKRFSNVEQVPHYMGYGLYDRCAVDAMKGLNEPDPFYCGLSLWKWDHAGLHRIRAAAAPARQIQLAIFFSLTDYALIGLSIFARRCDDDLPRLRRIDAELPRVSSIWSSSCCSGTACRSAWPCADPPVLSRFDPALRARRGRRIYRPAPELRAQLPLVIEKDASTS